MKHTPGPWIVVAAADPQHKAIVAKNAAGFPVIAETRSESFAEGCKPDEANARLISLAPEMFDFIGGLVAYPTAIHGTAANALAKDILNRAGIA